jgi:acetyltransferase-like isoleucine patch superfamily enzyme
MKYEPLDIERFENTTNEPVYLEKIVKLNPGARIIKSRLLGPTYLNRQTQVGPDAVVGRYFGMNESCYIARATAGHFCSIGARTAINPFNHPVDWLSIHEFQYHPASFDWVEEYNAIDRLPRTPDMFQTVTIGSDVWTGHNVNIMGGVSVGDGAIIGAGSVVTKDVPPFAIVAGVPASVKRLRFGEKIIERLLRVRWWDLELEDLSGLPFREVERCLDLVEEIKARKGLR